MAIFTMIKFSVTVGFAAVQDSFALTLESVAEVAVVTETPFVCGCDKPALPTIEEATREPRNYVCNICKRRPKVDIALGELVKTMPKRK